MGILDLFRKQKTGYKLSGPAGRANLSPYDRKIVRERWERITELLNGGKPSQLRQAVIESHKLLDYGLQRLCPGPSLGEKLKLSRNLFSPSIYQGLWTATKVRNSLVHESEYDPLAGICRQAVENVKRGLEELGVKF